ncbi:hypothetical protein FPQ18DRAFT_311033 [Pyronema domesticum]|nr:hypothetical protein FPQ18DRAFT_311033 [Pyronema domesticum]
MTKEDYVNAPFSKATPAQKPIREIYPKYLPAKGYHGTVYDISDGHRINIIRMERQPVPNLKHMLLELRNAISYGTEDRDYTELKQEVPATPENVYLRLILKWNQVIEIIYESYSWDADKPVEEPKSRTASPASNVSSMEKGESRDRGNNYLGEISPVGCEMCTEGIAWDHPSKELPGSTRICQECKYEQAANESKSSSTTLPSTTEPKNKQMAEDPRPSSTTLPSTPEPKDKQSAKTKNRYRIQGGVGYRSLNCGVWGTRFGIAIDAFCLKWMKGYYFLYQLQT